MLKNFLCCSLIPRFRSCLIRLLMIILWCQIQDELKLSCTHSDQILLPFKPDWIQSDFWKLSISINRSVISSEGAQTEKQLSEDFGNLVYYHALFNPKLCSLPLKKWICIEDFGPLLCHFCCLRRITLQCWRTAFDLLSESAEEDCLTHWRKVEFDARQGHKGEGEEIRVGKDTKMLALLEVKGVKWGGGTPGENRERRELRKLLCQEVWT